jgi:ribA/ribD-fused uncharacterized protein
MPDIDRFVGRYFFLSNFYPCRPGSIRLPIAHCGEDSRYWPTTEHAYQAAKTHDPEERLRIFSIDAPGKVKRLGTQVKLRSDWELIKQEVMLNLLMQKFADPQLREKLLRTNDARLIEGNAWGDTYWGQVDGVGENHLGRLLETVRHQLQHSETLP